MKKPLYVLFTNGALLYRPRGGLKHRDEKVVEMWDAEKMEESPEMFVRFLDDAFTRGAHRDHLDEIAASLELDQHYPNWWAYVYGETGPKTRRRRLDPSNPRDRWMYR